MNILMISPTPTHPTTSGNRARVLALSRALRQAGHSVHFVFVGMVTGDERSMRAEFGGAFDSLPYRPPRALSGWPARARRKLLRMSGSEDAYAYRLDDYYDTSLDEPLKRLVASQRFDAVIVEYVFMSRAFELMPPGLFRILDTHDRFGLRHRDYLASGQEPQWFSTTMEEEARGFRRADAVVAIQDGEAAHFSHRLGGHGPIVVTVGHLIDSSPRPNVRRTDTGPSALFLGSANPINVDAARWFIDDVLPIVTTECPGFRLLLAGDVCNAFADDDAAVVRLGRVASVESAFASATLAVNPVRMGTGLNIKMLEALACGAACVSSMAGSRGLEAYRGTAFDAVPDGDAGAMAARVVALLRDPACVEALGLAARAAAADWNRRQLDGLSALLDKAAQGRCVAVP